MVLWQTCITYDYKIFIKALYIKIEKDILTSSGKETKNCDNSQYMKTIIYVSFWNNFSCCDSSVANSIESNQFKQTTIMDIYTGMVKNWN